MPKSIAMQTSDDQLWTYVVFEAEFLHGPSKKFADAAAFVRSSTFRVSAAINGLVRPVWRGETVRTRRLPR